MTHKTIDAISEEDLTTKLHKYLREYPPAGYGTLIERKWKDDEGFHAYITRGKSCD